jgi:predicted phage tail protein
MQARVSGSRSSNNAALSVVDFSESALIGTAVRVLDCDPAGKLAWGVERGAVADKGLVGTVLGAALTAGNVTEVVTLGSAFAADSVLPVAGLALLCCWLTTAGPVTAVVASACDSTRFLLLPGAAGIVGGAAWL